MAKYRRERINDEFRNEIAVILREVKDPRVAKAFVSVTAAEVTPDLLWIGDSEFIIPLVSS